MSGAGAAGTEARQVHQAVVARALLLPLALTQFVASFSLSGTTYGKKTTALTAGTPLYLDASTPLTPNCLSASDGVPPADFKYPSPTTATSVSGSSVRKKRKASAPASVDAALCRPRFAIANPKATDTWRSRSRSMRA